VKAGERLSLEQIRAFLEASDEVEFEGRKREEVYGWVEQTLRYLEKMTGLSRTQITRLITMYQKGEEVKPKAYRRHRFPQRYTRAISTCWRASTRRIKPSVDRPRRSCCNGPVTTITMYDTSGWRSCR
jgi:hypothetical protein